MVPIPPALCSARGMRGTVDAEVQQMSMATDAPTRAQFLENVPIGRKLAMGFLATCVVLAVSVGLTLYALSQIAEIGERVIHTRVPAANAAADLAAEMNGSLAALRGYLLTGNPAMKTERASHWDAIRALAAQMDAVAEHFELAENRERWNSVREMLPEFSAAQDKAEAIAFTPDAYPATRILTEEAAPKAKILAGAITRMIDAEAALPATHALLSGARSGDGARVRAAA